MVSLSLMSQVSTLTRCSRSSSRGATLRVQDCFRLTTNMFFSTHQTGEQTCLFVGLIPSTSLKTMCPPKIHVNGVKPILNKTMEDIQKVAIISPEGGTVADVTLTVDGLGYVLPRLSSRQAFKTRQMEMEREGGEVETSVSQNYGVYEAHAPPLLIPSPPFPSPPLNV